MCTTNSVNSHRIRKILEDFLEGRLSLSQIQEMLRGQIAINFDLSPAHREIYENKLDDKTIRISVKVEHVRRMLQRYILGELSESELSNWAALIFLLPVFVPDSDTENERWDAGEGPVWDVIQRLVTPDIFGGLDKEIAQHYLRLLDR